MEREPQTPQSMERRQSQQPYQGDDRRKGSPDIEKTSEASPAMNQPRTERDEQERRAEKLHEEQNKN